MNVNIFIIRVLKLIFMKYYRVLVALLITITFILVPGSASLGKIYAGATIFVGESNLDISSALNGYTMIAWWPPGADMSTNPVVTLNVPDPTKFTIDVNNFSGYTGTWYTWGKQPYNVAFTVIQPQIDLKVWDVDHNTDITGQSVPLTTNITYRIDTNLWLALNYSYRPNMNTADTFYTVSLTNPKGTLLSQLYTGNLGAQNTHIFPFDSNPYITSSPYYGANLPYWDRNARSTDGSIVYPAGTYTFSVSQNLNDMSDAYSANASVNTIGVLTSGDKTVTFLPAPATSSPTPVVPATTITQSVTTPAPATQVPAKTTTIVPVKTTYTPLSSEVAVLGVGLAAIIVIARCRYQ
jgi:hypothetical protein